MGLKDKAATIDFGALPSASGDGNTPARREPRTAPGQMMQLAAGQREDLVARIKELEAEVQRLQSAEQGGERAKQLEAELQAAHAELSQWDGAKGTRLIPTDEIVQSPLANRHKLNFSSPAFEQLREEIRSAGGNVQPIKVRPLAKPRGGVKYEIVYGHRRCEACRLEGLPVLALVDNVDDQAMFIEMDRENRQRLDLSPWEQGQMYKRGLEMKLFSSARQMAQEVGISHSSILRPLSLAELPEEVVMAFPSPMDLQYRWAKPLSDALENDREGVLRRAAEIRERKGALHAVAVFERLLKDVSAPTNGNTSMDVKVSGKRVAVVQTSAKEVTVRIPRLSVPDAKMQSLVKAIEQFMSGATGSDE